MVSLKKKKIQKFRDKNRDKKKTFFNNLEMKKKIFFLSLRTKVSHFQYLEMKNKIFYSLETKNVFIKV